MNFKINNLYFEVERKGFDFGILDDCSDLTRQKRMKYIHPRYI